jgi:hypothetical protein
VRELAVEGQFSIASAYSVVQEKVSSFRDTVGAQGFADLRPPLRQAHESFLLGKEESREDVGPDSLSGRQTRCL